MQAQIRARGERISDNSNKEISLLANAEFERNRADVAQSSPLSDASSFRLGACLDACHSHLTPRACVTINGKAKLRVVLDHGLNSTDCLIGMELIEFLRRGERVLDLAEMQNLPLGGLPPFGFLFVELGERSLLHVFHVTHGNYSTESDDGELLLV